MVEKRPFPGDHGAANGAKRPKQAPDNAADLVAAARAKAAAKAAEIKARLSGAKVASASPTPPKQSDAPATNAVDRLAAMKARMAALKSGAPPTSTDSPPVRSPAQIPSREGSNDITTPKSTALGNRNLESHTPSKDVKEKEEKKNPYIDPKATATNRPRLTRGLLFNQRGKYLDQASKLRAQGRLEHIKNMLAVRARRAGLDENSERGFIVQSPPDVEWWDEGLLEEASYDSIDDPSKVKIDSADSIITIYVQHPVLLTAPQDQRLIQVKPMHLTAKEQAKLRRMRRAAEHKEQQAKIRLGLEPPPPPKVKRGNMMRVMGEQAIADPTAVEMLVETQIRERHEDHVKANEERKLSKEQKHEKLASNQQKDAQKSLHMCVFKVDSLAFGRLRYKVDNNAKQHALTGITIFHPTQNLIIVEGGSWSIQKYKKLLLNRVKWTENGYPTEIQEEKQQNDPKWMKSVDEAGELKDMSHNKCTLVFEGEVKQRSFRKWGSKLCESDGEAREILARYKLDSLWALAKTTE